MNFKTLVCAAILAAGVFQVNAAEKTFTSKSRWIWFDAPQITVGKCYYRTTIDFKKDMESVVLVTYMDDTGLIYLNGKQLSYTNIGRGTKEKKSLVYARKFDLTKHLKPGKNTIAVCVNNMKHAGGLCLLGTIIYGSGKAEYIHSDKSWKASGTLSANWTSENFDDSKWANAKEFMDVTAKPWADISEIMNLCRTPEEKAAK